MSERVEITEQVYKGETPSNKKTKGRCQLWQSCQENKGRRICITYKPKKGSSGKRKTKNSVSPSENTTGVDKTCLLHGPGHSSEECKVLQEYSKKQTAQRPHKENEACSEGKTKLGKSIKFSGSIKEDNIVDQDDPIPKKKREKYWLKNGRAKAQNQTQKTLEILMVLTTSKLVKLNMVLMTPNDFLLGVGQAICQIT